MNMFDKVVASIAGGVFLFAFGSWSDFFGVFLALWFIDVITGMAAAAIEGRLSSWRGTFGIAKKVMIACLIATAHFVDVVAGSSDLVRDSTLFFFIMNEFVSIIENAGRAGVPLPDKLRKAIELLKETDSKDKKRKEPPKA